METPSPHLTVGGLIGSRPAALKVLQRHRIDICAGKRTLADACREAGVTPALLLGEVGLAENVLRTWNWQRDSLSTIMATIIRRWHRPARDELPRLEALAATLAAKYHRPELDALAATVSRLRRALEAHLRAEEDIVFPLILERRTHTLARAIASMDADDANCADHLRAVRALTDDYLIPPEACTTWVALWHDLETFDDELSMHCAIETEVLFARALAGEDPNRGPLDA